MGAIGATISGAGPTVLVWTFWQSTGEVMKTLTRAGGGLGRGAAGAVLADRCGRAGAVSADDGSSLSLWSEDSFLSIASKGSAALDRIGRLVRLDRVDRLGRLGLLRRLRRLGRLGDVLRVRRVGPLGAGAGLDPRGPGAERCRAALRRDPARLRRRDRRLGDLPALNSDRTDDPATSVAAGPSVRIAPLGAVRGRAPSRCWSSTWSSWSCCSSRSRTSCPCCWASASCGAACLLGRTRLLVVRNAALVGGAQDRKRRGEAEAGHEDRQLARSQLHVGSPPWLFGLPTRESAGGARRVTP